jgi:hypothetical protein
LDNDQNAFAVAANTTAGDQLIFWLQAGGAGAVVDSYASVRFHGGAVAQEIEFDLGDGSLSGSATGVDPRLPVGSTIIRAETSGAVPTLSGADAVATDVDTLATYNGTVSLNGTTLDATFSPPLPSVTTPNVAAKAYCVDFGPAVSNWDGAADTDVMFRLITGDATGDAKTLLNDFALIKLSVQAGNPVLPGRERQDLNGNGAIELADVAIAKLHNGELHNGVASCP